MALSCWDLKEQAPISRPPTWVMKWKGREIKDKKWDYFPLGRTHLTHSRGSLWACFFLERCTTRGSSWIIGEGLDPQWDMFSLSFPPPLFRFVCAFGSSRRQSERSYLELINIDMENNIRLWVRVWCSAFVIIIRITSGDVQSRLFKGMRGNRKGSESILRGGVRKIFARIQGRGVTRFDQL